jgi:signal transduction histidine kinase/CheY-like chemotaxis protein
MPGSWQRRSAFALVAVVCLAGGSVLVFWRHEHTHLTLRAGIRNESLSSNLSPEGRVDTLAVEVIDAAARRRGMHLQWVDCPEGPDRALRSKKIDIWPLTLDLEERRKYFHITEPWLAAERCLVTKGAPPARWDGARVAYGLGPESELLLAAPGSKPAHFNGDIMAVSAVCKGEARAAYVLTQSLGAFVLRKPPGCETADFRITPVSRKPLKLGIGATFEAAQEAEELRIEIGRMAQEGALEELFNRYSLYSIAETANIYELMEAQQRTHAVEIGAGMLILALALLVWQVRRVREARGAAEKANRAKSEFLANMSHEIRTPLNGIVANTELLGRSGLNAEQRDMAAVILHSSESLMTIVTDLLDFSRIEAGKMTIEQVGFDVRAAAEDAIRLFAPRAAQKGIEIECQISNDVPRMILGDPVRIRQVLMNLLSNAIKFTEQGHVGLEVSRAGDPEHGPALLFRVIDTGIGIAPEVSKTLFRAFTQADSKTTRKFGGTGLGLAISMRLVSLMGGAIGLESEPGKGSAFWFVIPAPGMEQPAPTPLPAAAEIEPANKGRRILIVEDNPVNQVVAARALKTLGYATEIASGGEAALDMMRQERFDLILMDCQMPGMDGYETAVEIRRREAGRQRTPIVAMTANSVEGDRERCVKAGMDDYLSKPFRIATLERTLQRWLCSKPERSVA